MCTSTFVARLKSSSSLFSCIYQPFSTVLSLVSLEPHANARLSFQQSAGTSGGRAFVNLHPGQQVSLVSFSTFDGVSVSSMSTIHACWSAMLAQSAHGGPSHCTRVSALRDCCQSNSVRLSRTPNLAQGTLCASNSRGSISVTPIFHRSCHAMNRRNVITCRPGSWDIQ